MLTSLKTILCIIILMHTTITNAQSTQELKQEISVPIIVLEKFTQNFPSIEPVWDINYQGTYNQQLVYKGKFIYNNRSSLVVYDKDGNLLVFAATVEKSEIPDKINKYMAKNFPAFSIVEALLVTRGTDENTYEIAIYVNDQYVVKVFTNSGDFIKTTKT